jgi:hypothetical protein
LFITSGVQGIAATGRGLNGVASRAQQLRQDAEGIGVIINQQKREGPAHLSHLSPALTIHAQAAPETAEKLAIYRREFRLSI